MPDGTAISGEDEEELWDEIKEWYEANPNDQEPELQYPIQLVLGDQLLTVNNEDEMAEVKEGCDDEWDEEICFELALPLTFIMPDGTAITGNTEEELDEAIDAWYEANPNDEEPELQFPVDIIYPDSDVPLTINSEEEMNEAIENCDDDGN